MELRICVYGDLVASSLGAWWWPFVIEALVMIPLILVIIFTYKTEFIMSDETEELFDETASLEPEDDETERRR